MTSECKFVPGEIYKDRRGIYEFKFVAFAPEAHASEQAIFLWKGSVITRSADGRYWDLRTRDWDIVIPCREIEAAP